MKPFTPADDVEFLKSGMDHTTYLLWGSLELSSWYDPEIESTSMVAKYRLWDRSTLGFAIFISITTSTPLHARDGDICVTKDSVFFYCNDRWEPGIISGPNPSKHPFLVERHLILHPGGFMVTWIHASLWVDSIGLLPSVHRKLVEELESSEQIIYHTTGASKELELLASTMLILRTSLEKLVSPQLAKLSLRRALFLQGLSAERVTKEREHSQDAASTSRASTDGTCPPRPTVSTATTIASQRTQKRTRSRSPSSSDSRRVKTRFPAKSGAGADSIDTPKPTTDSTASATTSTASANPQNARQRIHTPSTTQRAVEEFAAPITGDGSGPSRLVTTIATTSANPHVPVPTRHPLPPLLSNIRPVAHIASQATLSHLDASRAHFLKYVDYTSALEELVRESFQRHPELMEDEVLRRVAGKVEERAGALEGDERERSVQTQALSEDVQ